MDAARTDFKVAEIENSIALCNHLIKDDRKEHTNYDMVYSCGREPWLASGKVPFMYNVKGTESKELHWASCWDVYISMDNSIPDKVHWLSIANSLTCHRQGKGRGSGGVWMETCSCSNL
eukprot:13177754-Ditylum_brightwellii.AAC.2